MGGISKGFKLFQPWANDVVRGKLNFLVRSIPTKIRGRVAVIATRGIDNVWLQNAKDEEVDELKDRVGAIGSVEIKDCIEVKPSEVRKKLIELAGEKYWDYYPKYLIPEKTRTGMVYIWILDKPREWREPKAVEGGGILWANIDLEDE